MKLVVLFAHKRKEQPEKQEPAAKKKSETKAQKGTSIQYATASLLMIMLALYIISIGYIATVLPLWHKSELSQNAIDILM